MTDNEPRQSDVEKPMESDDKDELKPGKMITVAVKTPKDKEVFQVSETATVSEFKAMVSPKFGADVEQLCLIFAGRILKDAETLVSQNIKDGLTIYLVAKAAPWPNNPAPQPPPENYSQAIEDVQESLIDDDYDMYYEIWQQYDPEGTQYIRYDQLSEFLDALEYPLQIHKPNKYKIVSMDIPICKGDLMFCVDILDSITIDFFARQAIAIEERAELIEAQARLDKVRYEFVSSTLWRQREEYCTRIIQNAWRKYKQQHGGLIDHSEDGDNDSTGDGDLDRDGDEHGDLGARQTAVFVETDDYKVVLHSRNAQP